MTDSDVYLPSASSTESRDTSYSSSNEEMEVASMVSHTEENLVHQTKISTKTDKESFSPAVFSSRVKQKNYRYSLALSEHAFLKLIYYAWGH